VSWDTAKARWRAQILVDGRETHLGYHDDEVQAARAYNEAAAKHFGEYARLNVIDTELQVS
jgi:hypothetical protein